MNTDTRLTGIAYNLCLEIEKLPPSDEATALSIQCSALGEALSDYEHKRQLPEFQCHKKVRAIKILSLGLQGEGENQTQTIIPEGDFDQIPVSNAWVQKHNPQIGGYYVQYEDGYTSYSPAEAFESGYTKI